MTKRLRILIIVLLSIGAVLLIGVAMVAFLPSSVSGIDLSAKLSELVGVVEVRNSAQDKFNQVNDGYILKAVEQLQTKEESRARLDLSTGSIIRLGQRTIFSLDTPTAGSDGLLSRIELQAGRVWVVLNGGSIDVNTPGGLASVRGSYMSVWVETPSNRITVCCLEGYCTFRNLAGIIKMTAGQKIVSSDPNILPTIEEMDQTDFQTWINNSPESIPVVTQVYSLVATSTPSFTADILPSITNTLSKTPTPTITSTPCLETQSPLAVFQLTPTPTATLTAIPTSSYTPTSTVTSTPTSTPFPALMSSPCPGTYSPTLVYQSTSTPTYSPTPTLYATYIPGRTPTSTNPGQERPTATSQPLPTRTQLPPTQPPKPTATLPAPTQPAPTQPAPTQPAPTQPAPTQPAPTQPAPTQPAPTQPAPTQPAPTEPAPTQPPYP